MKRARQQRRRTIFAIASGGGHWEQLLLLRHACDDADTLYITTMAGLAERSGIANAQVVPDCNRNRPFQAIRCALALFWLILLKRPDIILSTGALPGVIAMAIGRTLGARTIWVDSVANAEEMSMAGRKAKRYATLWLSQWPDVAQREGARYAGSVL